MGVRLSEGSSLQISCYQEGEVTWISKTEPQLSGRANCSSQLGTGELPPCRPQGRVMGVGSSPDRLPSTLGHTTASSLGQGPEQGEGGHLKFFTLGTSLALLLSWACFGDFQLSLLQTFGI